MAPLAGLRSRVRLDALFWVLVATIVFGAVLRFAGIMWGLPAQLHADEDVVVDSAIDMVRRNSFEPAVYYRPDHFEIQLSYLAYQFWSHLFGGGSPDVLFDQSQTPFYVISRGITATLGTAMIPLAYLIGARLARPAGVLMAIAVALFPPFVEHSRYATPDIPLTFAIMIVILGSMRYMTSQRWRDLVLACVGLAIAFTTKYPGIIAGIAVAVAVVFVAISARRPWQILSRGAGSLALTVAMIFAISPVLFTNVTEVRTQLTAQNSPGHLGADGLSWWGNMMFYVNVQLSTGGVLMMLFAAIGLAWLIVRRRWDASPILVGVVFWIVIGSLELHWSRWGLPMFLTVVLLSGLGGYAALTVALRPRIARVRTWVVGAALGLSALTLTASSAAFLAYVNVPDSRTEAAARLAELGATPENTFYDGYTPFRPGGPIQLITALEVRDGEIVAKDPEATQSFVLTSSAMSGRFVNDPSRVEGYALYNAIPELLTPVERWDTIGTPPTSEWEIPRLAALLGYIPSTFGDAIAGPELVLYSFPAQPAP